MTEHLSTPDLIRALGGADAICKAGCSCRGSYTGPERRSRPRHRDHCCLMPSACGVTGFYCSNAPCPVEGCDLFGPHQLHEDADGFRWGKGNPLPLDDAAWQRDEAAERRWKK